MGGVVSQTIFRTLPGDVNGNFPGDPGYAAPGNGATSGSTNTTQRTNVNVAQVSIPLVASSSTPRGLSFFNHGTNNVELCYGSTAATGNGFYILFPNGLYESLVPTTSAVSAISASGTNPVTPVEYL